MISPKTYIESLINQSNFLSRFLRIQRRIDFLRLLPPGENTEDFFETVLYPVFHALSTHRSTREFLYKFRLLSMWMASIKRHLDNENATDAGLHYLAYSMLDETGESINTRLVDTFLRCNGSEFIMRLLQYYKNCPFMTTSTVLLLLPFCETPDGRRWLEKNYHNICESLQTFERECKDTDYMEDGMKESFARLWTKFREKFDIIKAVESQRHGAELLEIEEREKVKREKKREKRRQKRQLQRSKEAQMTGIFAASNSDCFRTGDRAISVDSSESQQTGSLGVLETISLSGVPSTGFDKSQPQSDGARHTNTADALSNQDGTRIGYTYFPDPTVRLQPFQEVLSKRKAKEIKKQQNPAPPDPQTLKKTVPGKTARPLTPKRAERKHAESSGGVVYESLTSQAGKVAKVAEDTVSASPRRPVHNADPWYEADAAAVYTLTRDVLSEVRVPARPPLFREVVVSSFQLPGGSDDCTKKDPEEEEGKETGEAAVTARKKLPQETVSRILATSSSSLDTVSRPSCDHILGSTGSEDQLPKDEMPEAAALPVYADNGRRFKKPKPAATQVRSDLQEATRGKKSKYSKAKRVITVPLQEFLKTDPTPKATKKQVTTKQQAKIEKVSRMVQHHHDARRYAAPEVTSVPPVLEDMSQGLLPVPAGSSTSKGNDSSGERGFDVRNSGETATSPNGAVARMRCDLKPVDFLPPWVRDRLNCERNKVSASALKGGADLESETVNDVKAEERMRAISYSDNIGMLSSDSPGDASVPGPGQQQGKGAGDSPLTALWDEKCLPTVSSSAWAGENSLSISPETNLRLSGSEPTAIPPNSSNTSVTWTTNLSVPAMSSVPTVPLSLLSQEKESSLIDLSNFVPVAQRDEEFDVLSHDPDPLFPDDPRYHNYVRRDWFGKGLLDPRDLYKENLWMKYGPVAHNIVRPLPRKMRKATGKGPEDFPLIQVLLGAEDAAEEDEEPPDETIPHYWLPSFLGLGDGRTATNANYNHSQAAGEPSPNEASGKALAMEDLLKAAEFVPRCVSPKTEPKPKADDLKAALEASENSEEDAAETAGRASKEACLKEISSVCTSTASTEARKYASASVVPLTPASAEVGNAAEATTRLGDDSAGILQVHPRTEPREERELRLASQPVEPEVRHAMQDTTSEQQPPCRLFMSEICLRQTVADGEMTKDKDGDGNGSGKCKGTESPSMSSPWIPSWSTWRELLNHMQRLPEFYKDRIDRLTLPKHCSHFVIGQR